MDTRFSLHIVNPAFELLKRSAKILHFIAASVIVLNAVHQLQESEGDRLLGYSQVFIGADIFILLLFNSRALAALPLLNTAFRLIEAVFLAGIGLMLLADGHNGLGWLHLLMAAGYGFLFYRERRIMKSESLDISQTGIAVPNFLKDMEISWADVKTIIPRYHSILIETLNNKKIQFKLRRNLRINELEEINDFCSQHLYNG